MSTLAQIAIIIVAAAAIFGFIWWVYGAVVTPVRCGKNTNLYTVLRVQGRAHDLEHTLDGISWLIKNGIIPGQIILADCGMDDETREIVRLAEKKYGKMTVCKAEDVVEWIT